MCNCRVIALASLEIPYLTVLLELVQNFATALVTLCRSNELVVDLAASILAPDVDEVHRGNKVQVVLTEVALRQLVQRLHESRPHVLERGESRAFGNCFNFILHPELIEAPSLGLSIGSTLSIFLR